MWRCFEDYIVASYVDRFAEYTGETLKIVKTADEGAGVSIVFTEILLPDTGANPVRVNWRVERTDGEYRITDVQVEGVSMGGDSAFGFRVHRARQRRQDRGLARPDAQEDQGTRHQHQRLGRSALLLYHSILRCPAA